MELHKHTCEVCGDDFETTEILTEEDDIICDSCEDDLGEEDELETEFDDEEEDEEEDDEEFDEDEETGEEDEDE